MIYRVRHVQVRYQTKYCRMQIDGDGLMGDGSNESNNMFDLSLKTEKSRRIT